MSDNSRVFAIGLLTGMVLTAAVAYGLAPAIANRATQRGVRRLFGELSLPSGLSDEFARRAGALVASEVQRSIYA